MMMANNISLYKDFGVNLHRRPHSKKHEGIERVRYLFFFFFLYCKKDSRAILQAEQYLKGYTQSVSWRYVLFLGSLKLMTALSRKGGNEVSNCQGKENVSLVGLSCTVS